MDRRFFIKSTTGAALFGPHLLSSLCLAQRESHASYLNGKVINISESVPGGKRVAFGWKTVSLSVGGDVAVLSFPEFSTDSKCKPTHFRISMGMDERDTKVLEVLLPETKTVIDTIALNYVSQFQVYEIELRESDLPKIRNQGLGLRLVRGNPLEIFVGGKEIPEALLPHLLLPGEANATEEFFRRMNSLASIQQFGWMEGCVVDGLIDLSELPRHKSMREMAFKHLSMFFVGDRLIYEGERCEPRDDNIYGIEGTLPFAALAKLKPDAPQLDIAIKYWMDTLDSEGVIKDWGKMTSEGSYTVGYAMVETAKARKSEELMDIGINQVRLRQKSLFNGDSFWRTDNKEDGHWSRGIAWQLIGEVRTFSVAKEYADVSHMIKSYQQLSEWAMKYQRQDGLWAVYVNEPSLLADTAGSSGIAAALAMGVNQGWLGDDALVSAKKAYAGIEKYLTADGFLDGVSQCNKGGGRLQRSDFRCIYQMGMGLYAQLIAALEKNGVQV